MESLLNFAQGYRVFEFRVSIPEMKTLVNEEEPCHY